jgi:hypothetical protein
MFCDKHAQEKQDKTAILQQSQWIKKKLLAEEGEPHCVMS